MALEEQVGMGVGFEDHNEEQGIAKGENCVSVGQYPGGSWSMQGTKDQSAQ